MIYFKIQNYDDDFDGLGDRCSVTDVKLKYELLTNFKMID